MGEWWTAEDLMTAPAAVIVLIILWWAARERAQAHRWGRGKEADFSMRAPFRPFRGFSVTRAARHVRRIHAAALGGLA